MDISRYADREPEPVISNGDTYVTESQDRQPTSHFNGNISYTVDRVCGRLPEQEASWIRSQVDQKFLIREVSVTKLYRAPFVRCWILEFLQVSH